MYSFEPFVIFKNGFVRLSVQATAPAVAGLAAQSVIAARLVAAPAVQFHRYWAPSSRTLEIGDVAPDPIPLEPEPIAPASAEAEPVQEAEPAPKAAAQPKAMPKSDTKPQTKAAPRQKPAAKAVAAKAPAKKAAAQPKAKKAVAQPKQKKAIKVAAPKAPKKANGKKPSPRSTTVYQSPTISGRSGSVTLAAMPEPKSPKEIN